MKDCVRDAFLVLLLMLVLPATPTFGQQSSADLVQPNLKELGEVRVDTVYGVSKFLQKVLQAPSSVTIVTADQIRKYGYRTLADVLRSVPGMYVTNDRNYSYLGISGFNRAGDYNSRVLILIDGHRMNETVYDAAYIGTEFPVDVDLIDRVEIIRGPGSVLYGSDAFLAVINVITRHGGEIQGVEVSSGVGSLDTYRARVSYGQQFQNGLEVLLSAAGYDSKGDRQLYFPEFNTPASNNGIAQDADTDEFYSTFFSATYRGFSLHSAYETREKRIPTASFGTVFNDRRNETTDTRGYFDFQYQHEFGSQWELNARTFFDRANYDGTYVYDTAGAGTPPYTLNEDFSRSEWIGFDISASTRFLDRHRITLGTEERFILKDNQGNFNVNPYHLYLNDQRSSIVSGVYAQDEFKIRRDLILSAGIRFDYYDSFGGTANPRLGLIYSPQESTAIKLLYGTAFRAPNAYELYYRDNASVEPNSNLKPERIKTTELVFEKYFIKHLEFRGSGFYNQIADLISESMDPQTGLIQYITRQSVVGKGLELELDEKGPGGWEGRASYTVQQDKDTGTGRILSDSPKHLAKLNFIAPIAGQWLFGSLEGQYMSNRLAIAGTNVGDAFVANASLYVKDRTDKLRASLTVFNLSNKQNVDPGGIEHIESGIPEDGRTINLRLTYRFGRKP